MAVWLDEPAVEEKKTPSLEDALREEQARNKEFGAWLAGISQGATRRDWARLTGIAPKQAQGPRKRWANLRPGDK